MTEQNTQQDENKLIAERRSKLQAMRDEAAATGGTAFPNSFRRDSYCGDLQAEHGEKTKEQLAEAGLVFAVAGRVIRNRGAFMEIQDMSGRIQLYVTKEARPFAKSLDLGDIIGVKGELHKSGKGDLYVQ
ncbi:MAG: OB-fold nucleic acid binding domain-containing protein, partial [Porticoccaceae bacterium]|nr:OB-fold nucleic acid binding domain-containing protein [Porticoccaceae bacterium]